MDIVFQLIYRRVDRQRRDPGSHLLLCGFLLIFSTTFCSSSRNVNIEFQYQFEVNELHISGEEVSVPSPHSSTLIKKTKYMIILPELDGKGEDNLEGLGDCNALNFSNMKMKYNNLVFQFF